MIPVPVNLINFIGENNNLDRVIEQIIQNGNQDLKKILIGLGRFKWVRIRWKSPVKIKRREVSEYIFKGGFFKSDGLLCYLLKRNGRTGFFLPRLDLVESYEPVNQTKFIMDYEKFKRKFDSRFITPQEIKRLWNGTSAQHGGKYNFNDFRHIGSRGLEVLRKFMRLFKGVNEGGGAGYIQKDGYSILSERYFCYHNLGRDITITHQTNLPWVTYSSEYHNCSNGRYGLIANEKEYLWLEDD